MPTNNSDNKNPLTIKELIDYNQNVLFPFLEETFSTKKEISVLGNEFDGLKSEFNGLRNEFNEFKDDSLTNQDAILKKLDILLAEKTVREYQESKEKKMWVIVIRALKEHRILSAEELKKIAQLQIF